MWEGLNLSKDTEKMLSELIKRKKKWDRMKVTSTICAYGSLIGAAWVVYRYFKISTSSNISYFFQELTEQRFFLPLVMTGAAILAMTNYAKRTKEAKEKYEKLRVETIKHLDAKWTKADLSERRDKISLSLKESHDINIYYVG